MDHLLIDVPETASLQPGPPSLMKDLFGSDTDSVKTPEKVQVKSMVVVPRDSGLNTSEQENTQLIESETNPEIIINRCKKIEQEKGKKK